MTTRETIEQLESLQAAILESSEYVFGEKLDYPYVEALRSAITALEAKEVEELKK